ncbi:MAG: glycosyltransferase family 10, partial [Pseudomonadota bacterium]
AHDVPLVYIASNPVEHRDNYVRELMQHIAVDSPGRCLNNCDPQDFVQGNWMQGGWNSIVDTLPRYKFYLAFENSVADDYVTERVFHALSVGVVPVYRGAKNVREFMPADDAIIDVADFSSPRELAQYLHHLNSDDAAYQKHLRWKRDGFSDSFRELVNLGSIEPKKRLAIKLAHDCDRSCRCGGRVRGL